MVMNSSASAESISNESIKITKGYVDGLDGQMHYRMCGQASPPSVLFLHSSPHSSAMFTAALPRMASRGLTSVAIDLLNSGESFVTDSEPMVEQVAANVLAAVKRLGFTVPFTVVGHQAGAALAVYLASVFPDQVGKLVLWGLPLLGCMERGDVLREEAPDYADDFFDVVQSFVSERYPEESVPWQLKVRGLIEMLQTYERRPYASIALASVDYAALLKQVEQPALCLAGDVEPFQKSTMKSAMLLQGGKYQHLGSAGCDVVDEFPEEYVQQVADFVQAGGGQLARSSCTDIAEKSSRGGIFHRSSEKRLGGLLSPTTPLEGSISRASTEPEMETGRDGRVSSESERRGSTERRRPSIFKGILKGRFLGD